MTDGGLVEAERQQLQIQHAVLQITHLLISDAENYVFEVHNMKDLIYLAADIEGLREARNDPENPVGKLPSYNQLKDINGLDENGFMFIENITEFDGIYNGNGYSISNASVISGKNYGGLFGYLKGVYENGVLVSGIIENLNLINIMVNANGAYYIGNIVGYAEGGRISGCVVQGSLKVSSVLTENYNIDIGGIVGFAQNTIIENVSFAGYINVKTASSVSAGGIAGRYQTPPAIESVMLDRLYSFAEISVTTDKWALLGGIIGGVDLLDGGADVYNDLLGEYAYLKNSLAHITSTSFEGASRPLTKTA